MTVIKGARRASKRAWLGVHGSFLDGIWRGGTGKRHLAHKLDAKLTYTYQASVLVPSPSLLLSRNTQSNQDLLVPAWVLPKHQTGRKRVGSIWGPFFFFGVDILLLGL